MTIAELERSIASKLRVQKVKAQEKANFDYVLADLIGRSISRLYSSSGKMPDIADAYPALFDKKEIQEGMRQQRMELSAERFKQFAKSYNKRHKGGGKE